MQGTRGSQSCPRPPVSSGSADSQLQITIQVLHECGKPKEEICQLVGANEATVEAALSQDRYAIAAKVLAKKKVSFQNIAQALNMSEARVHGAIHGEGTGPSALAGRLLGSTLQMRLDELCDEDSEMCCPVTLMLFRDPVIASDGFMYEAESVKQLIRNRLKSPITREPLQKEHYPAKQKKSEVIAFREKRGQALLQFAKDALTTEPRMAQTALDRVLEYLQVLGPSQYPALSRPAATIWEQTGKPLPNELRPFLGLI